ncbi:alpha/beta hydrolase [Bacillus sp. FJAT-49736]|uniref:alpha/beta hydrolase n=1 Tax=Bacillus sp. FJAT-49736 TaxID=2833582 RepID=UPI001BCA279E|nr:alpha/beta hydrolase [Bacillus sp. FJAT-49736]MBS4174939.1 lysophospholipase [Bacillus sp. FJAT-49736]
MRIESSWVMMNDNIEVFLKSWKQENLPPYAILQLSHGMAEHIERYDEFARFLVSKGIFVYGNDHRGHGHTGEKAGLHGYFSDGDGFERVVDDLYEINQVIQHDYPKVPIFLFGHSMGSFLARRYIQKYGDSIKGVIISGTGGSAGLLGKIGKMLAQREMRKNGPTTPSPLMNRLTFGNYNKSISNPNTEFDWLSSDSSAVDKYINDPFCGFVCSSGFFHDLISGIEKIHQNSTIQSIPKNLPIFIFSGEKDPVGGNTKGVRKVIEQYERNGLRNIDSVFFKNGRHEMLNEVNKLDVFVAIQNWLFQQLEQSNEISGH